MTQPKTENREYWLGGRRKAEQDIFFQQALNPALWKQGDKQTWDACWYTGMPAPDVFRRASPERKINHIPGNSALTIKSNLYRTVSTLRDRLEEQFGANSPEVSRLGFLPRVYAMPEDYHELQEAALEDPAKHWILKPANASRGRGIRVLTDVATAPVEAPWMVQQYLEKPHTMRGRKYVLRLYVLIASIEPLRVYLYEQGFAKLASEPYDVNDADNIYSQLTNPDINALNEGAEAPVEFVDLDRYRQWLREEGHDDAKLFEQIHDLVTLTMMAALEPMHKRSAECKADPRGCYELLGLDCLIDADLKPWILECNLSPSLGICAAPEDGGEIEQQIKSALVADMTSLVGLNLHQPTDAQTQQEDYASQIARQAQQELERAGGFRRLYPTADAAAYLPFFAFPRLADMLLADAVTSAKAPRPALQRRFASDLITDDELALYHEKTGQLMSMNDTAAFIWLMAMEGAEPDEIAKQLSAASCDASGAAPAPLSIRRDVWSSLAQWAQAGLLMQTGTEDRSSLMNPAATLEASSSAPVRTHLRCGSRGIILQTDSSPAVARLEPLVAALACDQPVPLDALRVEVLRDKAGYALAVRGEIIATRLPLATMALEMPILLARHAATEHEVVLDANLIAGAASTIMLARTGNPGEGDFLQLLAEKHGRSFTQGLSLDRGGSERAEALGLPGQTGNRLVRPTSDTRGVCRVDGVIVPVRMEPVTHRDANPVLQPLSVNQALTALLPGCSLARGRMLSGKDLKALAQWLSGRPCYALDISEQSVAAEALSKELIDSASDSGCNCELAAQHNEEVSLNG